VFERFTERARQVVVLAQDEARLLKHNYIGTEHILLGLLREEEGLAARLLASLDVTVEEVRAQVVRLVGQGDEVTPGQIPFTPRAKKVLELSLREALSLSHNYIGTEHVLLGLVRIDAGVATRILLNFDLDAEKIRNEIIRMLSGPGRRQVQAETETPHVVPDVASEIERVREEKERAIEAGEFERAAALRDRERDLVTAVRRSKKEPEPTPEPHAVAAPAPFPSTSSASLEARSVWQAESLLAGWTLFGVAAGLGVFVGRLIWG
jgi:ATP-dependent Clp protease ATP-binding subunit ClpA